MAKVYVLSEDNPWAGDEGEDGMLCSCSHYEVKGVFTSLQKAEEVRDALKEKNGHAYRYDIKEYDLDAKPYGVN